MSNPSSKSSKSSVKLDFSLPLWDQVVNLSAEEYEKLCDRPAIYGDAAYSFDYSTIRLYSNPVYNYLTESSLLLCYAVWLPQALWFWSMTTTSSTATGGGIDLVCALLGVATWYGYAYGFHRMHHNFGTQWTGSYAKRLWHFNGHGYHHICPHDERRIVIHPAIASIPLVPHGIFTLLFKSNATLYFQFGLLLGHMVVEATHYSVHYFTVLTPVLKALKNHHLSHHYKQPDKLFAHGHKVEDKFWSRTIGDLPARSA